LIKKHDSRGVDQRKLEAIRDGPLWLIVRQFANTEMHPLLEEIKHRKKDDRLRKFLMNYLIIRTLTVFEVFMLNMAVRYIDDFPEVAPKVLGKVKQEHTIGHQLASAYSFINKDHVDYVFSQFLGKNFLREIRKESVEYADSYCYESEHIKWASPIHKKWRKFELIFNYRHSIVHHNKLYLLDWKEYRDMIETVLDFMMCATLVVPLEWESRSGRNEAIVEPV
jgi:hypothetical protein